MSKKDTYFFVRGIKLNKFVNKSVYIVLSRKIKIKRQFTFSWKSVKFLQKRGTWMQNQPIFSDEAIPKIMGKYTLRIPSQKRIVSFRIKTEKG